MKLHVGGTTKTVEMTTPQHVATAMKNPLFKTVVFNVTDATDHADLLKKLNNTSRPYAVAVLVVAR